MNGHLPVKQGLYDPAFEHDGCGIGFVVNTNGSASHEIVSAGIEVLKNLVHRGAIGGDLKTGDGAGILTQIPHAMLRRQARELGFELPRTYGVAMIFMPRDEEDRTKCRLLVERTCVSEGLPFLGWRKVPVEPSAVDGQARRQMPEVYQGFIGSGGLSGDTFERKLYVIRRVCEKAAAVFCRDDDPFYVTSMSSRTIVYKGLFTAPQLPAFYSDLKDPDFASALAVVHQRYSTNTFPSWQLAQPFRYLGHNGEINTLRGNLNLLRAREPNLESPFFGQDIKKIIPVIQRGGSDSAALDNILELLVNGGRSLPHAMLMLIPEAWGAKYPMGPDQRGFFEYHAGLMEPWDGPAAVVFSDGRQVGGILDRNGLRPARFTVMKDGLVVLSSEVGVLDIPPSSVSERGALRPGEMILVDLLKKRILKNGEIKTLCARRQPYRRWVEENKIILREFYGDIASLEPDTKALPTLQRLFGYTREDLSLILEPMASTAQEPVGSMGADSPLAVLSERNQLLFNYFKQLFAQVTNPAIDPVREELVMSLMTFIGNTGNILSEVPQNSALIKLRHPFLSNEDLIRLKNFQGARFKAKTVSIGFPAGGGGRSLRLALEKILSDCEEAIAKGHSLIILSDRGLPREMAPIPSLLAVSALNQRLVGKGLRASAGLIVETGDAREVMHMALLLGYGATAINPYLAFESVAAMAKGGELTKDVTVGMALENYVKALCKGLLKIMSKMGISTLRSYRSAQVFEAVGLNPELVDEYFLGTPSRVGGIGLEEIATEAEERRRNAYELDEPRSSVLPSGGFFSLRLDGERHQLVPESITTLQRAVRTNDYSLYKRYASMINRSNERLSTLRGLFGFKAAIPVPIEEVEGVESIMKRFVTGAMSFGAISKEAHETIAIAMNRIGAMSNCGEGGEDPYRYRILPSGDSLCSAVKQVASGRFGVTAEYLVNCKEIQIKIAQGAKPGEGGQLPGHKVNAEIARVRHSTPGVTLISPPPHHDIYSIEDLAQLIFDLKNVNPLARISVKLVSEIGVGTVAAGVAKGRADMVLISGFDGGTGASPLSSIRHAGAPWELGLSETQQTLVLNNLRERIRVQVDGQMKTGRDVVVAALLGAEEYGFATIALVVLGCVMMRKCHTNNCPVGIATQDPELRRLFSGRPEYLENFFRMVAQDVREHMSLLGFRSMDEMIGRSEALEMNRAVSFWKARGLDLSRILYRPATESGKALRCVRPQSHPIEDVLDRELISLASGALEKGERVTIERPIRNVNRTTCAMLSGEIAKRYGNKGLPDDTVVCRFKGAAGQSFGAFGARGLTIILEGEANDYLGKGLSGAKIIVKPYEGTTFRAEDNMIAGNVILYGATSGEVYINGRAGERFAIRNSGAKAVVEGVGDHGCEYMTGGRVVVLGETGINFAAGMSGGIAYVYDETRLFDSRCNLDMVDLELVTEENDMQELMELIKRHFHYTGSAKAKRILADWKAALPFFVKVFPMEYRRALGKMSKEDEEIERAEVQHG
jgi:glutamate synthase domain-containing protein 2/glutamate synthase domain-containing protein 1/glutamate synthase domain-containing protein 3